MPSRAQRERSDRRRALGVLAGAPEGVTEALMLAHGFRVELLVDLCLAGLATARPEHIRAGGLSGSAGFAGPRILACWVGGAPPRFEENLCRDVPARPRAALR